MDYDSNKPAEAGSTAEDFINQKYEGKNLCKVCKSNWHPDKFEMCFECWGKQKKEL